MLRLIILLVLLLSSQVAAALSYTMVIPKIKIQQKLESMMPIERKKFLITVKLSHPQVELSQGSNQIGVNSRINITLPGQIQTPGTAKITGILFYEPTTHEFFLKNPIVQELRLDKVSDSYLPTLKDLVQLGVRNFLEAKPIYKLKDGDLKNNFIKVTLKSVVVQSDQLLVELELF